MADLDQPPEDILVERFRELCLAEPSIYKKIAYEKIDGVNVRQLYYNQATPVGKKFNQVNYYYSPQRSEEVLPSESGLLNVTVYAAKDNVKAFSELSALIGSIEKLINKRPHVFDQIDVPNNVGLHCVRCLRISRSECGFDEGNKVYYMTSLFDMRISDRYEDYSEQNNQPWNPLI